jgi:hypothetical protein
MIIEALEKNIYYYKNVIDEPYPFIREIEDLDLYKEESGYLSKWLKWTASTNEKINYGYKKEGYFYNNPIKNDYDKKCLNILNAIKKISDDCIHDYILKNNLDEVFLPNYISIRKYNYGADMGPHVDSEDPTDKDHPYISGVLYLNDNYDGGEIEFPNQNISIKPEAGSMIIFPSYRPYFHHPKPPINNNKYMCPFFWYKK